MPITLELIYFEHPSKYTIREKELGKSEFANKKKAEEWAINNLKQDYCAKVYDKGELFATYYGVKWERKNYITVEYAKPINHKIITKIWDGSKWIKEIGEPTYAVDVCDSDHNVILIKQGLNSETQARNIGRKYLIEHPNPKYHSGISKHTNVASWGNGHIVSVSEDKGFMKLVKDKVGYFIGNPYVQISYKTKKKHYKYRKIGTVNGNGQIVKK